MGGLLCWPGRLGEKSCHQKVGGHVAGTNWHEKGPRGSPEYFDYLKLTSFSVRSRS